MFCSLETKTHQMQYRAALHVVIFCLLLVTHLLAGKDQPAGRTAVLMSRAVDVQPLCCVAECF